MARKREFRVLVATDGSPSARAAVAVAKAFPWPRGAQAHGVVARRPETPAETPRRVLPAFDRDGMRIAAGARRALAQRWPGAEVAIVNKSPVKAILDEARRLRVAVVVLSRAAEPTMVRHTLTMALQLSHRPTRRSTVRRGGRVMNATAPWRGAVATGAQP